MRTRTIVVLLAAGLALLGAARLGGADADWPLPAPADPASHPPGTAEVEPTSSTQPSSAGTEAGPPATAPPPTAPPEIEDRGMGDPVGQRWPVTELLPKDTSGWRIDYRVDDERLVLIVELRAVLNRPDQLDAYRSTLVAAKAEALAWLEEVDADPATYQLEWRPPEAAGL